MSASVQTTKTKINPNSNVNDASLSENNKQMYDLCCFISNMVIEEIKKNNSTKQEINSKIFNDTIKRYKLISKKRNRRVVDKDCMCMGRKLDSLQCTRRRLPGQEYCLSHVKNRPNGRVDQEMVEKKPKGRRGRKRKNNYDPKQSDPNYITMWEVLVDNKKYFCDKNNNIYSFNETKPTFLGRLTLDCTIDDKQKPKIDFSKLTKEKPNESEESVSPSPTPYTPTPIEIQ
jgi:hypothetical protein